ncbi:MAG: GMC family oxidoreductase N-terminal domain-containing protein [Porticoccaceae bacterium]
MRKEHEVDYVIVGAGTAGCVLASRLSEDPNCNVALLEAGGEGRHPFVRMPGGVMFLMSKGKYDWGYSSDPDPTRHDRVDYWLRGKLLGGSSAINGMVYVRGHPGDYDDWQGAGASGWSYADVLPFFRKIETTTCGETDYRGRSGPMSVAEAWCKKDLTETFITACEEVGIGRNADYNGRDQEGVALTQANQRKGRRHSAADAYLKPAKARHNLQVHTSACVRRIVFDGKRAVGVEYSDAQGVRTIRCRKEVLLAAGAINTPQILMLSGVGDPGELARHGIRVQHESPGVGRNLLEHPCLSFQKPVLVPSLNAELKVHRMALNALRWLLSGSGPVASAGSQAVAFIKSDPALSRPDLQLMYGTLSYGFDSGALGVGNTNGVTLNVNVSYPFSRGAVRLRSADPAQGPSIQPRLLDDPRDLDLLIRGAEIVHRIFSTSAFRKILAHPGVDLPADRAAMIDFVRQHCGLCYHPAGTCRMGSDDTAVVDPELKVHGLSGLRVVDASVFPSMISGNTNAAVLMVAEKAADIIMKSQL